YAEHSAYNRAPATPGLWLGPYRVTAYDPARELTTVANPYWKGPPVAYKQVVVRLIGSTPALMANLLSGDVDVLAQLGFPLTQLIALEKQHGDRFDVFYRTTGLEHLAPRLDQWPLSDRRVRQAVLQGIDRAQIAGRLFEGHQQVANELLSPAELDYDPGVKPWPYDPAASRALLASAGFRPGADGILVAPDGRRLVVTITTTAGNTQRELIETVMQSELKALGVELVIKNEPARTMFGETLRHRAFDGFVMYAWTPTLNAVPWSFLGSRFIPSEANGWSGINFQGYASPAMDTLLDTARGELDPEKRRADVRGIVALAAQDLPVLPLFYFGTGIVQPKRMTGLIPPPLAGNPTAWIEQWRPR
ncbi:MAG: peptide ABC transporter substrate-binding protein, partial [Acetobacteraceae bacterium]|nr:peptide ABC transporter substrate-binding protein [Acetobacteraceae bacterium]